MRFYTVLDTKMNQFENAKKWLLQLVLHPLKMRKKWLFDVSHNSSYFVWRRSKNRFYVSI